MKKRIQKNPKNESPLKNKTLETNIYYNHLINYSPETKLEKNNISFAQLFSEDLKSSKISDNILSITFLVMGIQSEILKPLIKKKIKILVVLDYGKENEKNIIDRRDDENLIFFYPKKKIGNLKSTFHPKIYIIKFKLFIRIVIGSCNLFIGDWSCWNNIFYIKDFYLNFTNYEIKKKKTNFFFGLEKFLDFVMGDYKKELFFDFAGIYFEKYLLEENFFHVVFSLPGYFDFENKLDFSGLFYFRKIIEKNQPKKKYNLENFSFYYSTSSLGTVSKYFLFNFLTSLFFIKDKEEDIINEKEEEKITNFFQNNKKKDNEKIKNEEEIKKKSKSKSPKKNSKNKKPKTPKKKSKKSKNNFSENEIIKHLKKIHIIYPTQKYTKNSLASQIAEIPLFLTPTIYYSKNFLKNTLSKYKGKKNFENSEGVLSHCKIMVLLQNKKICDDTIIYFGSHNFSQSAWGRFLKNRIKVNNYEFGLVLPPEEGSKGFKEKVLEDVNFDILSGERYDNGDLPYMVQFN